MDIVPLSFSYGSTVKIANVRRVLLDTHSIDMRQFLGRFENKMRHLLSSSPPCISVSDSLQLMGSVHFLDGSWFLQGRNGREEFERGPRILGAQFLDIDDIASKDFESNPKQLPHMMPSPQLFASCMDEMGILPDDDVIVYGTKGCLATHRAWFQLRAMGHDHAYLMQGNLDDWIALDGPIETGPKTVFRADDIPKSTSTRYPIKPIRNIVSMDKILQILNTSGEEEKGKDSEWIFVDARSNERFHGLVDEPRPNLRLGHIPGARNIPFMTLLDPNDVTKFKPVEELRQILNTEGDDKDGLDLITAPQKIIVSCGSGATACAVVAALELCGRDLQNTYVYDGSWAEWGAQEDTPIVTDSS